MLPTGLCSCTCSTYLQCMQELLKCSYSEIFRASSHTEDPPTPNRSTFHIISTSLAAKCMRSSAAFLREDGYNCTGGTYVVSYSGGHARPRQLLGSSPSKQYARFCICLFRNAQVWPLKLTPLDAFHFISNGSIRVLQNCGEACGSGATCPTLRYSYGLIE